MGMTMTMAMPMTPGTGIPELATRSSRLSAASVDGVVGLLAVLPACISMTSAVASAYILQEPLAWTAAMTNSIAAALVLLLILSVATLILVARNGQTIGKKALGIKVVRSDGSPARSAASSGCAMS